MLDAQEQNIEEMPLDVEKMTHSRVADDASLLRLFEAFYHWAQI